MHIRQNTENKKLRTDVILADRDTGDLFSDKLRQIFIALPLFQKDEKECETDFERWIFVLKNMETLNRMPFKAKKAVFKKLEELAEVAALSYEDLERYENSVNVYRDNLVVMEGAQQKGMEEGIKKGMEEGMKKGLEEGIKEGRKEEKKRMAKQLIDKSLPMELIIEITGLTAEEIRSL